MAAESIPADIYLRGAVAMSNAVINAFPGYEYIPYNVVDKNHHNMYRGIDLKFGGYVYSEPGIHTDVALLDIQSMHPNSAVNMNYFGEYTQRFKDILDARIAIKNHEYDKLENMFDGKLIKYLTDDTLAEQLATALKLAINSVYGLTSATFENPFRDARNVNNIVALRGALFMKTLQDELVERGYTVAGIRTDSIKIPNADNAIIQFCMEFADKYGYSFQHEATYERLALVDKANYIATYMKPEMCMEKHGYIPKDNAKHYKKHAHPWTSTGDKFQRPYIFKGLFSGEPINFDDLCETKSVSKSDIYLDMNEKLPDVSMYEKERDRRLNNKLHPDKLLKLNPDFEALSDEDLSVDISKGHDYHFVGGVGRFCPIKPGLGGGLLVVYRRETGKYNSVSGGSGYRWMEADIIKELGREDDVDRSYHQEQTDECIKEIEKFGSFDRFIDLSRPYEDDRPKPKAVDISEVEDDDPPWNDLPPVVPCGDGKYNTCMECPHCRGDVCDNGYSLAVENGG